MAQLTKTVCDVFGTSKDIQAVSVKIRIGSTPDDWNAVVDLPGLAADLSPRAVARLKRFIERGLVSAAEWKEWNDA